MAKRASTLVLMAITCVIVLILSGSALALPGSQSVTARRNKEVTLMNWLFATDSSDHNASTTFVKSYHEQNMWHISRSSTNPDWWTDRIPVNETMIQSFLRTMGSTPNGTVSLMHDGQSIDPSSSSQLIAQGLPPMHSAIIRFEKLPSEQKTHSLQQFMDLVASVTESDSIHAYFSNEQAEALKPHTDPYDVAVVQLAGSKEWTVCFPGVTNRTRHLSPAGRARAYADQNEVGKCVQYSKAELMTLECSSFELKQGDTLYLPEDTIHFAQTGTGQSSLHLTIALGPQDDGELMCHDDDMEEEEEEEDNGFMLHVLRIAPKRKRRQCYSSCDLGCDCSCDSSCDYGYSSCDYSCDSCCDTSCDCSSGYYPYSSPSYYPTYSPGGYSSGSATFKINGWGVSVLVMGCCFCCAAIGVCFMANQESSQTLYGTAGNDPEQQNALAAEFLVKYEYSAIRRKFFVMPFLLFGAIFLMVICSWIAVFLCYDNNYSTYTYNYLYSNGCLDWFQLSLGAIGPFLQLFIVYGIFAIPSTAISYQAKHEVMFYVNASICFLMYMTIEIYAFQDNFFGFVATDHYYAFGILCYFYLMFVFIYSLTRTFRRYEAEPSGPGTWKVNRTLNPAPLIFVCILAFISFAFVGLISIAILWIALAAEAQPWTLRYTQSRGFSLFNAANQVKIHESSMYIASTKVNAPVNTTNAAQGVPPGYVANPAANPMVINTTVTTVTTDALPPPPSFNEATAIKPPEGAYDGPKWDCMHLTKDQALARLANQPPGTFVVRPSDGSFAVISAVKDDGSIGNYRVLRSPEGQLYVQQGESNTFTNIKELVTFYADFQQKPLPMALSLRSSA